MRAIGVFTQFSAQQNAFWFPCQFCGDLVDVNIISSRHGHSRGTRVLIQNNRSSPPDDGVVPTLGQITTKKGTVIKQSTQIRDPT